MEAPVLAAAGHLDDVELTYAGLTLRAERRQIKTSLSSDTLFKWKGVCVAL